MEGTIVPSRRSVAGHPFQTFADARPGHRQANGARWKLLPIPTRFSSVCEDLSTPRRSFARHTVPDRRGSKQHGHARPRWGEGACIPAPGTQPLLRGRMARSRDVLSGYIGPNSARCVTWPGAAPTMTPGFRHPLALHRQVHLASDPSPQNSSSGTVRQARVCGRRSAGGADSPCFEGPATRWWA